MSECAVTIKAEIGSLREICDLLLRLESVPEFPLQEFLDLLFGMLEELPAGGLKAAPYTGEDIIIVRPARVFELFAAALRAMDRDLRHD